MSALFISDVHLEDADGLKARLLIRFFDEVVSRFRRLYIVGDLFDVWPGTDSHLTRRFQPVLKALENLVDIGCEVNYIEGNHDFCLGDFFSRSLGVRVHDASHVAELGAYRVFMSHGDLVNPSELGYHVLRKILRAGPVQFTRSLVPGAWVYELGKRSSELSRNIKCSVDNEKESIIREVYRKSASNILAMGYDVVVMGHTHLPDDVILTVDHRQKRYINLGDWVKNFTYLEFDGQNFYTKSHPIVSSV